jgi:hypothetical protein
MREPPGPNGRMSSATESGDATLWGTVRDALQAQWADSKSRSNETARYTVQTSRDLLMAMTAKMATVAMDAVAKSSKA